MISIQTNVDSLNAQRNLGIDNAFQSKTIEQLTSGYRINKSGDDAAGLAIANGYASTIAQLNQGVSNANNGLSQLQIVDGGLSNISTILNRLQTLATQSASATFTGDRGILNQEYASLTAEITRQASNINLNAGGSFNTNLNVFIGGGSDATSSSVNVNLSGASNAVDAASLGLANTNVSNGGVSFANNTNRLDAAGATFLQGSAAASQSFTFNLATPTGAQTVVAKVQGSAAGIGLSDVLSQLNGQLNQYGISAGLNSGGTLQFSGATAFNVTDGGPSATAVTNSSLSAGNFSVAGSNSAYVPVSSGKTSALNIVVNGVTNTVTLNDTTTGDTLQHALATIQAAGVGNGFTAVANANGNITIQANGAHSFAVSQTDGTTGDGIFAADGAATIAPVQNAAINSSNYSLEGQNTFTALTGTKTEVLTIQTGSKTLNVTLNAANAGSAVAAAATINAATTSYGVNAVLNTSGRGIEFQGATSFSVNAADFSDAASSTAAASAGIFAAPSGTGTTTFAGSTAPQGGSTNNATAAIAAIAAAIKAIGVVQGTVGAGENTLSYATSLAQSQISSFSSAESQIKDADVAAQAANLTKAQVLTQTSVAALAQANSEPQAILKLLQG